jgi:tRNA threonylcarbamoyladenosine biosynthesis protein TsaB
VALSDGAKLIAIKELNAGYTHAENLHLFIREILTTAGLRANQLKAIAVSSGPGSYTGLRIGFSAAKGLAYALNIPLIVVETLKVLTALAAKQHHADVLYCPMLDARRMEVYTAVYTHNLEEKIAPQALLLSGESIGLFAQLKKGICFFGDGMPKAKTLLESLPGACFTEGIATGSEAMISLAYEKFQKNEFSDTAYAEPFYLKDFFFTTPKK